jgi:bis(5'-nucleosyl)-tetraphosphatase (symmetrical)
MATYLIGDLQGCHADLLALLECIGFDPACDRLWFTGDLVNRGPASLAVLRTVQALGERALVVLGNHDLHLLACRHVKGVAPRPGDTLDEILAAPDCDDLLDWLRTRPLLHHDPGLGIALVHAGLPPQWSLAEALALAAEASAGLAGPDPAATLRDMYGNRPDRWDARLAGADRFRFVINALTRLRYVDADGRMELKAKGAPGTQRRGLVPWFAAAGRRSHDTRIAFGHWSTLRLTPAERARHNVLPLDTGAVWGGSLTAWRVEDDRGFAVPGSTPVPIEAD